MSSNRSDDTLHTSGSDAQDFIMNDGALALGRLVTHYQALDHQVIHLYAALSECRLITAYLTLGKITASDKRSIVLNVLYNTVYCDYGPQTLQYMQIVRYMSRHKTLTEKRNKIIHGSWTGDERPQIMYMHPDAETLDRILGGDPRRRKEEASAQDKNIFSVEDVTQFYKDIHSLARDISDFLRKNYPAVFE